jgi:hypothetical protein
MMRVDIRNADFYEFEMIPELGTGNLSDVDYLEA